MKQSNKIPIIDVKKYGGKHVAIVDGRVVAAGSNLREAVRRAKEKLPSKPLHEIHIFLVPKTISVGYAFAVGAAMIRQALL